MSTWRHLTGRALRIAVREAPRLLRQSTAGRRGTGSPTGRERRPAARVRPRGAPAGRHLDYAPDLDGRADPGEVVWTWVPYEEDVTQGKDRPVLVVGRDRDALLGLMLSSRDYHDGDPDWMSLGAGGWDAEQRPSWVRLDRVVDVPEDGIRREGAVLDRSRFDRVAAALRQDHGWR